MLVWIPLKGDPKVELSQSVLLHGGDGTKIILGSLLKECGRETEKAEETMNGVFMSQASGVQSCWAASER